MTLGKIEEHPIIYKVIHGTQMQVTGDCWPFGAVLGSLMWGILGCGFFV